jgi:predicted TIM-barrel fold metal-dependent hydrolase
LTRRTENRHHAALSKAIPPSHRFDHIHADPQQFPFFPGRIYTPELASPEEMSALHRALKIKRVVIVTPSVYGTDNSATLLA